LPNPFKYDEKNKSIIGWNPGNKKKKSSKDKQEDEKKEDFNDKSSKFVHLDVKLQYNP
jgi:hypothetical protein